jgi:hypothetical protein
LLVLALLPVHTAAASWKARSTACNLAGDSYESCIRGFTVPVDLLWAHVALAGVCLAWTLAQAIRRVIPAG